HSKAKLVLLERRLGTSGIEEGVGIELGVAQKLEGRAMKIVGAGPDIHIDGAAEAASEFGGQQIRLHLKLGNGVRTGQDGRIVVVGGVIVDAVEKKVVVLNAVAVDPDQEVLVERIIPLRNVGAWGERDQLDKVAAIERQLHHSLGLNHLAERRR